MHPAIPRQRTRLPSRIGLATIALALCAHAQAGDTRRCQINGRTIITNLSCEQLANEAGITLPERDKSQLSKPPPKVAPAPAKPTAQTATAPIEKSSSAAEAAKRGFDALLSMILIIGAVALLLAALFAWLKHKAKRAVHNRLSALAPIAREALEPMLDKALAREDEELPYHQAPVMSRYELEMFERLKTALPECEIFPQVPLASFIRIDKNRAGSRYATNSYRWQNRIGQQRVDFLACLRQDMSTVAAIELDDPSHENTDARLRDAKKDKSLKDANVPLIRWRVEAMPEVTEIRREFLRRGLVMDGE
jgi:hypothetical protein